MSLAVLIGRFQPLHPGHIKIIEKALTKYNRVLVLIGDTGGPRTIKNPWTYDERLCMFALSGLDLSRLTFRQLLDHKYNDTAWVSSVHELVNECNVSNHPVFIIGHNKDASTYYLKMFPTWGQDFTTSADELEVLFDATNIRCTLFSLGDIGEFYNGYEELEDFIVTTPDAGEWLPLEQDYEYIQDYRNLWSRSPFRPVFVTVDAVVVGAGHILLVQRAESPGKGLWALPGGFIDQDNSIEDNCIRELIEETNIKLQPSILKGYINKVKVFDRSGGVSQEDRGRVITHAHLIKLDDTRELPKIKAGEETERAEWVPLHKVSRETMFSDHYHIIQEMI